ncbi:MAG: AMP-binding protein, partial [Rubrobacteraceae bacterium]
MTEAKEGALLWEPSEEFKANSNIAFYMRWLEENKGVSFGGYEELWEWSVTELEEFWASIWEYFDVQYSKPYTEVLGSRQMPGAEWFPGAELNYAEHVFRNLRPDEPAIMHQSEVRELGTVSWQELYDQVSALAAGLKSLGVERGDRVVAYVPNTPEALIAFLATASLGATWSSCSPDFGAESVVDRFEQIEPKVLIAVDGYRYGGKDFDRTETVARLQTEIKSLEKTVLIPYLNEQPDTSGLENVVLWEELLSENADAELQFEQVPFDHPLWVLYSSGTTGLPKALVHGHGGVLLEHLKKLSLHMDVKQGDPYFWFTTTGWMMWNVVASSLLVGGTALLYDGS